MSPEVPSPSPNNLDLGELVRAAIPDIYPQTALTTARLRENHPTAPAELVWQVHNVVSCVVQAAALQAARRNLPAPEIVSASAVQVVLRWPRDMLDEIFGPEDSRADNFQFDVEELIAEVRLGGTTVFMYGPDRKLILKDDKKPFPPLAVTMQEAARRNPVIKALVDQIREKFKNSPETLSKLEAVLGPITEGTPAIWE